MDRVQPFDAAALTYDETFTNRQLGIWLREMVRSYVPFQAGDHILELGCGTGEDAVWLAKRGVQVTATDASSEMLARARQKIEAMSLSNQVNVGYLDMNDPNILAPNTQYDGAFANFGAINCVSNRNRLAEFLAQRVRVDGVVVVVMMGPLCLWEIGWHFMHGEVRTAFRRLRSGGLAHVGGGKTIPVWFPSPRHLRADFAPWFRQELTVGIGTLLPPSYLDQLVEQWPRLFKACAVIDRQLGRYVTNLNDHYLAVFRRV
jgi:SAM-dependent methyltransferase